MKFKMKDEAGEYTEPLRPLDPLIFALRKRRYDLNLSASAVGRIARISSKSIQKYENGHALPHLQTLRQWAKALKMEIVFK